jgi:hypothetical protein
VENGIFDGGPPSKIIGWLRLRESGKHRVPGTAIAAALAAWLPLAVLAAARGDLIESPGVYSFLRDIAVHARYLIAVPLLVAAQSVCVSKLGLLARHFRDCGLVGDSDHELFDAATASTRRLQDTRIVEIAVIAIAYAIVVVVWYSVSPSHLPAWHTATKGPLGHLSPAGWWHVLVSMPLLLVLLLGWLWRLLLWARFLWLMSRLNLRLLPSHPDRVAGLQFAGDSIGAYAPFAVALSVIVAGMVANRFVYEGASLLSYKYVVLGVTAFVMALYIVPLLVFGGRLQSAWQRGVLEYGALAERVGLEFERVWLGRSGKMESPLVAQAFSATNELFQLVSNVYKMRFLPLDPHTVILLVATTLLPFVPLLLVAVPFDVVLKDLARFLF